MGIAASNASSFGLPGELVVSVPFSPPFCSLYADGPYSRKAYSKESGASLFSYAPGTAVFLYYTYPSHRAASLVRNVPGKADLPYLSKPVFVLWTVHASKVDKLKRALSFLNKHFGSAYGFGDCFYLRLYFILLQRGKLDYIALRNLSERSIPC
jgi:hypothetical protein